MFFSQLNILINMSDEKWLEGDSDPAKDVYEDGEGDEPAMPDDPVEEDPVRMFLYL